MLKDIRVKGGFETISALARASGVSDSMLGAIERGERAPGICTLSKLAVVFKMTIGELIEKLRCDDQGGEPDANAS